jgi:hypothetical protein
MTEEQLITLGFFVILIGGIIVYFAHIMLRKRGW